MTREVKEMAKIYNYTDNYGGLNLLFLNWEAANRFFVEKTIDFYNSVDTSKIEVIRKNDYDLLFQNTETGEHHMFKMDTLEVSETTLNLIDHAFCDKDFVDGSFLKTTPEYLSLGETCLEDNEPMGLAEFFGG